MATRQGTFCEFDSANEDWTSYTERLQQYFAANEIVAEEKQRAILLSCCGPHTYQLIKNLAAPVKPPEKTFVEIVKLVKDHLNPRPSTIVQRFIFNSRSRKESETIATFITELKRLSEHCGFGETLQEMLRDRLVCGINDNRMQHRLLSEPDLTYKKAFDVAQAMESAERNVQDLHLKRGKEIHMIKQDSDLPCSDCKQKPPNSQNPETEKVYLLSSSNRTHTIPHNGRNACNRCGGKHQSKDCNFREATCFKCSKKGHIARVCRSKPRSESLDATNSWRKVHLVRQHSEETEQDPFPEYNMFNIRDSNVAPLRVEIIVSGVNLPMEVDRELPSPSLVKEHSTGFGQREIPLY